MNLNGKIRKITCLLEYLKKWSLEKKQLKAKNVTRRGAGSID